MNIPRASALAVTLVLGGCAQQQRQPTVTPMEPPQRAQRIEQLTRETDALRNEALESRRAVALLENELGLSRLELEKLTAELRTLRSRAEVVAALADARIALARIGQDAAPWERRRLDEGRNQLAEAERHIAADRIGSALFFVLRAQRIAAEMRRYRRRVARDEATRYVNVDRANVRTEPSIEATIATVLVRDTPVRPIGRDGAWIRILAPAGEYGWIHRSLVSETP